MEEKCSIKIKLKDFEIEVSGSKEFVDTHITEMLEPLLNIYINEKYEDKTEDRNSSYTPITQDQTIKEKLSLDNILKSDFSVWKKTYSNDNDNNNITAFIMAGYYIQLNKEDHYFTTKEVFSLLYNNGIFVEDIKNCENMNIKNKNIKKVGTDNNRNKYQINEEIFELIHEILELGLDIG